ncbi:MAG: AMP-binding protein [Candidatus Dormibacteria bacterium]
MRRHEGRTLGRLLQDQADRRPDRPFLRGHGSTTPLGTFTRRVNGLAGALRSLGVGRGTRVGIMLPNDAAFMYAWFGVCTADGVEVPINCEARGEFLRYLLISADPVLLILGREFVEFVDEVAEGLPPIRRIVVEGSEVLPGREDGFWQLCEPCGTPVGLESTPEDLEAILFTSGTTGHSKGVMVTHNMAVWTGEQAVAAFGVDSTDVWYTTLPLFHVDSQNLVTISALLSGAVVGLGGRFSARRFWSDIEEMAATRFMYIGAMLEILLKSPYERRADVDRWVLGIGSPVRAEIHDQFEQRFRCSVMNTFGMTEITNPIWMPIADEGTLVVRRGAAGLVSSDYDCLVVDEQDRPVPAETVGELVFRSHRPFTMFNGYWGAAPETVEAWRNLWFHSGDLGYLDCDGFVWFSSRKKDAIRRRGENISAFELEAMVGRFPGIGMCAATAYPSTVSEDDVRLFIVADDGVSLQADEIYEWCRSHLPRYMVPRYIEVVTGLPMTATAKIDKAALRRLPLGCAAKDYEEAR